jgi:hypothetical protein
MNCLYWIFVSHLLDELSELLEENRFTIIIQLPIKILARIQDTESMRVFESFLIIDEKTCSCGFLTNILTPDS